MTLLNTTEWWKNAVIYQIYPKSFADTTGSGQGDLNGITEKLDYLKQLGVDALWITPVYPSPQIDNGYDVADYCQIDPTYGTLADFTRLTEAAHQRGIRIIMDMVFNHTSTEHAWFKAAEDPESPWRDFYLWQNGDFPTPPTQWRSKFGGNAWQWHAASQQYYLHLFSPQQADLNWEHPPVREALKQVCRFWAAQGVDWLRLDVINLVSKTAGFPEDPDGDGRRFYTDGPRIHEFLQEFSRDVFQPLGLMTVGEMSSTTLEACQQYADLRGDELSMTFNFHHLKVDYAGGEKWSDAPADLLALKNLFRIWQQGMHNRAWNALFWCNHDQPRIVSRFGNDKQWRVISGKMLAMVLHGMQGTPYIYQGEEIGMTNPGFSHIGQYRDVESLNMYQERETAGKDNAETLAILARKSRDNSRTPMQWNNASHAGFTTGSPWIDVCENYTDINVEKALGDPESLFYLYQKLIALRKAEPIFTLGDYDDLLPEHPSLWCYVRHWEQQKLTVLTNFTAEQQPCSLVSQGIAPLLTNYPDSPACGILRPYECVYLLNTA
ncbi:MAG: Trehalose-6-phosphate hydrolase [Candidatus Erwinia impunctatus]|nr:Trehalose-6-phosphate hydrolase [Culicoides impunctatus]